MNIAARLTQAFCLYASLALAVPVFAQTSPAKPHPALPSVSVPDALGVNIHFTDARKGEMEMLQQGGFRVIRMDFAWGSTEKVKGEYDFSDYDRLLKQLKAQKLQPLFILDYSNRFYDEGLSPYSETGRAAFAKWAAAAALHFKGHKILWEMYNEPNGFWKPKKDVQSYIKLALATGKAIREAAPGECYIGPGVAGMDFEYLEACFEAGLLEYWDGVTVHPYRRDAPETVGEEYRRLRLMIERYKPKGKSIPVLSGEWGYSSTWSDDSQQGKYLPRQWMTNLMNQIPVSIWYDWHDDGTDSKDQEHNFGTTRNAYFEGRTPVYDPKPSYIAARAFSNFFDGFRFNKRLALSSPHDYLLLFSKGNEVKLAAWTTGAVHEITVPASPGTFKATDYLGKPQNPIKATAKGLQLKVSDTPLYLEPSGANEVLRQATALQTVGMEWMVSAPITLDIQGERIRLKRDSLPFEIRLSSRIGGFDIVQTRHAVVSNPLSFVIEPGPDKALTVRIKNPNGQNVAGQVSLGSLAPQNVAFSEREKVLTFTDVAPLNGIMRATARFQSQNGKDALESTATFVPLPLVSSLSQETLTQVLIARPDGNAAIESEQSLTLQDAPDAAPSGSAVLKLKYRFSPGWKFINVQPLDPTKAKIEGRPKRLGMWVFGDQSNNRLRMRFRDSTTQTFQPDGVAIDWKGWRYVSLPIDNSSGHWGGANDGEIHGDIQIESLFLFDSVQAEGSQGEIYVSAPTWIY